MAAPTRTQLSHFEENLVLNLAGSGPFTAGSLFVTRRGPIVTVEIGSDLNWVGSLQNLTSDPIIPARLRTPRQVRMVARVTLFSGASVHFMNLNSTGNVFIEFRNASFNLLALTSASLSDGINGAVISYSLN